jgi:hypothetical protein
MVGTGGCARLLRMFFIRIIYAAYVANRVGRGSDRGRGEEKGCSRTRSMENETRRLDRDGLPSPPMTFVSSLSVNFPPTLSFRSIENLNRFDSLNKFGEAKAGGFEVEANFKG